MTAKIDKQKKHQTKHQYQKMDWSQQQLICSTDHLDENSQILALLQFSSKNAKVTNK